MASDLLTSPCQQAMSELEQYSLLDAMRNRRSRRFAVGATMNGGPLAFESRRAPQPLSIEEEALLAFAGCGITGPTLSELPYDTGEVPNAGGGNIMIHFIGRTIASADAMHFATVFVINDDGVWMVKRPQDHPQDQLPGLVEKGRRGDWVELYEKSRVQIADHRLDVPREIPFIPPFNKWSANLEGTTYFLPVCELTTNAINFFLSAFSEEFSYYIIDEKNGHRSAGLKKFAKSRGGHLYDNPSDGRVLSLGFYDNWLCQLSAIEEGAILQNLALMTQALGLGGFPHFAAHPYIWMETLGFRMEGVPATKVMGADPRKSEQLREAGRDEPVPTAVGLEHDGEVLIKPFCPPYYKNMEEAVLAFLDYKFNKTSGTLRDGSAVKSWKDPHKKLAQIPKYSDQNIAATIACCEYIYERYGRFPASSGPFHTILAHQAHHLDPDFYQEHFQAGALSPTQQQHQQRWHG